MTTSRRMPVAFVAHGSPMAAVEEDEHAAALRRMGRELPRPSAIAILSAHWETRGPMRVNASPRPPLIYDFSGFPEELYRIEYPCPGDPSLAEDMLGRLKAAEVGAVIERRRGIDHGAWVPLRRAYPEADIPVVEISLPVPRTPEQVVRAGSALAPLRERGVLLMGTGGIVHNLHRARFGDPESRVEGWAKEFDDWVRDRVEARDVAGLMTYASTAPGAAESVPTPEHFDPIFFVLGASHPDDRLIPVHEGFQYGNLSLRSFLLA